MPMWTNGEEYEDKSRVYKSGRVNASVGLSVKPQNQGKSLLLSSNGKPLGPHKPKIDGPFSALTPSMWPQNILSTISKNDLHVKNSEYTYDQFGFREERSSIVEDSNSVLRKPLREDSTSLLRWSAYLEFTCNKELGNLTWDKVDDIFPKSDGLLNLVRTGIPHSMRSQIWPRLSGAKSKESRSEVTFMELIKSSSDDNAYYARQIERDLIRTLPTHACFSNLSSCGIPRLRRVLRAIAWLYPEIGYCQGTGLIASTLLMFIEEEECFWMMCSILEDVVPASYYTQSLVGVQTDQRVLRQLMSHYLPDLDMHLKSHDIELSLITLHWFLTLFAGVVHTSIVLRIWDQLFYEGSIVLFRLTLALLKMKERELLSMENSAQIFNAISNLPGEFTDAEELFDVAFKHFDCLSMLLIDTQRRKHMAYLVAELKDAGQDIDVKPKEQLSERKLRRTKSMLSLFFAQAQPELIKEKNVRQTELISDLRESILQIAHHFQSVDSKYKSVSLQANYSHASHADDQNRYVAVARNRRRRAKALLDFERHDDDELGFKRNDVITIISMKDDHCWVGEFNGLRGWFPAKFVELLDERSKQYTQAGDDAISDTITDLVRGHLGPNLTKFFNHGMKQPMLGHSCHPWLFIEEASSKEIEKDFRSVYSRLTLCKAYRLDEDGKVLTPDELLFRSVIAINQTHDSAHVNMDVKLRSLIAVGLNEQVLHLWLEILASTEATLRKWYYPTAYMRSPGWVQVKCELRILSEFSFNLSRDRELPPRKESIKPMKDGIRDLLVKHHLFSWNL